jgi:hypothetical protein
LTGSHALGDNLRSLPQHERIRALSDQQQITAEAYIRRLAERGIDYVFANAGTDFAPIIEAISRQPPSWSTSRSAPATPSTA